MGGSGFFEELVRKTAHRFPKQVKDIYLKASSYYKGLCQREAQKPEGIRMLNEEIIFPSIAFYKAIIENTGDTDRAYDVVSRCYEDYLRKKAEKMRDKCRLSVSYPFVTSIAGDFIKRQFNDKAGFEAINRSKGWKLCHIDIVKCPYHEYCKLYGCEELTTAFCYADDIIFEHLHRGISWDRTLTLGRGDDHCDFIISVDD